MTSVCLITAVVLFLASLGSSSPLHDDDGLDMAEFTAGNTLDRFKVHFNWRNISCPVCKAFFTVLDVALLVRNIHLLFL